jgi:nucleoside-diphosphate-sugar epimerase
MKGAIRLFVFGLGYSAGALARAMIPQAESVGGTVRTADKAVGLGIEVIPWDGTAPSTKVAQALAAATHLVVSIPPGKADPVLARFGEALRLAPHLQWIGYLSTVGVYGDYGGAWVCERTTPHPKSARAVQRLAAEKAWGKLAAERNVPLAIFRLAGIYGPGRNALVNLAEGKAHRIVKPGQMFNRIHVDDIVETVTAAMSRKAAGIFNVTDNEPAPPQDVVAYAASLMGIVPPPEIPFAEADLSPMARSFYGDNKRVANALIKRELGIHLRFPTYREGLESLWRQGDGRARSE